MIESVQLGGVSFRAAAPDDVAEAVAASRAHAATPLVLGYANPHVITLAAHHASVGDHLRRCDLVLIDGVGVQVPLRLRGHRTTRCAAHHCFERVVDDGSLRGRIAVIGIEAAAVPRTAAEITRSSAGRIDVALAVDGFADDDRLRSALGECGRLDAVVIGAGSPRSEEIARLVEDVGDVGVVLNVGAGTLKSFAGTRRDAPRLLHRLGLAWVHRYVTEPHTRPRYRRGVLDYLRLIGRGRRLWEGAT